MKKGLYIFGVLIIVLTTTVFASCRISSASEITESTISMVEKVTRYMKTNPDYEYLLKNVTTIDIHNTFLNNVNGDEIFLVEIIGNYFWSSQLFLITASDDGDIINVEKTQLGGLSSIFEYDIINISQGTFIVAYCSTHMGNGSLDLVPIDQPEMVQYSIFGAVDCHNENNKMTAIEYELSSGYDDEITASAVYLDGKLHADFSDVNNDGNTDIVLTGIQRIYKEFSTDTKELEQEYYIKKVYLFDPMKDDFIFNDEFSIICSLT